MNTFRTMSRLLVVTVGIFASNAIAFVDLEKLGQDLAKVLSKSNVAPVLTTIVGVAGGLTLKEQLAKENPIAISAVAGLASGAMDNPKAGLISAGTSLAISGVRKFAPEVEAVNAVTDKLPKCLTSKEAKLAAQIVVASAVGHYLGGKTS